MTDRENLFSLMKQCKTPMWDRFFSDSEMLQLADYLIAHGVTVKQMQKPLTVDEAIEMSKDEHAIFYVENNLQNSIFRSASWASVNIWLNICDEKQKNRNSYGRTWRCWAKRPTDEERKAAEWEK